MKNLLLFLTCLYGLGLSAQSYSFSKTAEAYTPLSSPTVLAADDWSEFFVGIKLPFAFKYWGATMKDSVFVDDFGGISMDSNNNDEILFFGEDLQSRGAGKSVIAYKTTGTAPNRILKIEYKNVGFDLDVPDLKDSMNVQCWIYEGSDVIEFRYGPGKVKSSTWSTGGPFVGIIDTAMTNLILLQNNPSNPTVNKDGSGSANGLTGKPASGTVYRITPTSNGLDDAERPKVVFANNQISILNPQFLKEIRLFNTSGQLIQSATSAADIQASALQNGVYFVSLVTTKGNYTTKIWVVNE